MTYNTLQKYQFINYFLRGIVLVYIFTAICDFINEEVFIAILMGFLLFSISFFLNNLIESDLNLINYTKMKAIFYLINSQNNKIIKYLDLTSTNNDNKFN